MTLLVAGWVALDEIETPAARVAESLGGSATCAALAAARFTDVRLFAVVGDDFPRGERARLEAQQRIDLAGLTTVPGGRTSRWGTRYREGMNTRDTLYTEAGVNAGPRPPLPAGWEASETAFAAAAEPTAQRDLLRALTAPRATMIDTIEGYVRKAREAVLETMAEAAFVSVNDAEARMLTGECGAARAGRALLAKGARAAIVKLGEYGAVCLREGDYFAVPAWPVAELVDPTGAGDAFAGGFLGALDRAPELTPAAVRRAVVYGSVTASFAVEGFGPSRLLSLERDEIEERYRRFRDIARIPEDD